MSSEDQELVRYIENGCGMLQCSDDASTPQARARSVRTSLKILGFVISLVHSFYSTPPLKLMHNPSRSW